MQTIPGIDPVVELDFDNAYWAFQPLDVQPLRTIQDYSQRVTLCQTLSAKGRFIDVPVMMWGWDPFSTMKQRESDGYTTYPDATYTMYRPVDLDPTHYPATPIPVPPAGILVGAQYAPGSQYFFLTSLAVQENLPVGFPWTENGYSYVLQYITQQALDGRSQQIGRWLQVGAAPVVAAPQLQVATPLVQTGQTFAAPLPTATTTITQGFPGKAPGQ